MMRNSSECSKRKVKFFEKKRKVKCFATQMSCNSRHSMVILESFVNYFAWEMSGTIILEAPNGNEYDVGITEHRNKKVLRSGWEAFVDTNHIAANYLLMFRYRGTARFKVVVFDSSGCEKLVSSTVIQSTNITDQEPSTSSTDMSSSPNDSKTQSSGHGRSDGQSGSSGHCRKRAKKDTISYPSEDLSGEDSSDENEPSVSNDHELPKPLYVLSGRCAVTEEHRAKIGALVQEIKPEMSLLLAMMTKPSVKPYPDLTIPQDYALAHFPRKNKTIIFLLPGQTKKWHCEFRVRSDGGRCSRYWCDFALDNHLLEGDLCLFQPMKKAKGRTFKVMVHLFRNAGEETFSLGYEDHGINEKSPNHDDTDRTCNLPYMMPLGARLTEVQKKNVLEKVGAIASELHIYVAVMTKTSVYVSLTFGTKYAAMYLRKGNRNLAFKIEGKRQTWHGELRDSKGALRISGGWTSFARDNHLREGDICLFQLMKYEGQPKMMVYIIRSKH